MKRVEVRLREAARAPDDKFGVKLARYAFDPSNGPLTDMNEEAGEREAVNHLFSGAVGAIKNPQSHRDVNLDDPAQAAALVMFASYLLRVIDSRAHRLPDDEDRDQRG